MVFHGSTASVCDALARRSCDELVHSPVFRVQPFEVDQDPRGRHVLIGTARLFGRIERPPVPVRTDGAVLAVPVDHVVDQVVGVPARHVRGTLRVLRRDRDAGLVVTSSVVGVGDDRGDLLLLRTLRRADVAERREPVVVGVDLTFEERDAILEALDLVERTDGPLHQPGLVLGVLGKNVTDLRHEFLERSSEEHVVVEPLVHLARPVVVTSHTDTTSTRSHRGHPRRSRSPVSATV